MKNPSEIPLKTKYKLILVLTNVFSAGIFFTFVAYIIVNNPDFNYFILGLAFVIWFAVMIIVTKFITKVSKSESIRELESD